MSRVKLTEEDRRAGRAAAALRWYHRNRERVLARKREMRTDVDYRRRVAESARRWRAKDPDRAKALARAAKARQMSVPENRVKHLVYQAGRRAARNGVPFDIRLDDLLPLPTHCPVLGIELIYRGTGGRGFQHSSPSIDRFIPALGYVRGNVRIISMRANRIKCDATLDELRALVRYMEAAL